MNMSSSTNQILIPHESKYHWFLYDNGLRNEIVDIWMFATGNGREE